MDDGSLSSESLGPEESVGIGDDDWPKKPKARKVRHRCEANNNAGRRCARSAVQGQKVCSWHGGKKHRFLNAESRYSKYLAKDDLLRARFMFFFDDPDICDLRPELALSRTVLSQFLELAAQTKDGQGLLDERVSGVLNEMTKSVGDLAERVARMEKKGDGWISRHQLDAFVEFVVGVVSDHITDHVKLQSIQRQLEVAALPSGQQAALVTSLAGRGHDLDAAEASEGSGDEGGSVDGDEGVCAGDGECTDGPSGEG